MGQVSIRGENKARGGVARGPWMLIRVLRSQTGETRAEDRGVRGIEGLKLKSQER